MVCKVRGVGARGEGVQEVWQRKRRETRSRTAVEGLSV
jgi:hypothetical protein